MTNPSPTAKSFSTPISIVANSFAAGTSAALSAAAGAASKVAAERVRLLVALLIGAGEKAVAWWVAMAVRKTVENFILDVVVWLYEEEEMESGI